MKKNNNTYLKRIFRLALLSLLVPIGWIFLYSRNEGWGTDACPNMKNCLIELLLLVLPFIRIIVSTLLFIIDIIKNKILTRRLLSISFILLFVIKLIDLIQQVTLWRYLHYVQRCSYINPDFIYKLPSAAYISLRWILLSILILLWSYFVFDNTKGKKKLVKILLIILWVLIFISWIYCLYLSFLWWWKNNFYT
jgi:hypothetical protein